MSTEAPDGPARLGRPTKLTPRVHTAIVESVRAGNYAEQAARAAGIHKATFYEWLKKGEAAQSGIYRDFSDAIERAAADAEAEAVRVIRTAMFGGNWKAAMVYLERRHPDRWRRRTSTEISGPDQGPVSYEGRLEVMSDPDLLAEYERLRAMADRRAAAQASGGDEGDGPPSGEDGSR